MEKRVDAMPLFFKLLAVCAGFLLLIAFGMSVRTRPDAAMSAPGTDDSIPKMPRVIPVDLAPPRWPRLPPDVREKVKGSAGIYRIGADRDPVLRAGITNESFATVHQAIASVNLTRGNGDAIQFEGYCDPLHGGALVSPALQFGPASGTCTLVLPDELRAFLDQHPDAKFEWWMDLFGEVPDTRLIQKLKQKAGELRDTVKWWLERAPL